MAKADNQWQRAAAQAAERIDAARESGQLVLFDGDEGGADVPMGEGKRGKGKALSKLRDILQAKGLRMPEDVLANMAALDDPEGPVMAALKKAETVGMAIYGGACPAPVRMRLFETFYAESRRALDALLPYGLGKVTPDMQVTMPVQVVTMPAPSAQQAGDLARDVTPRPARMAPPPMPDRATGQIVENQGLGRDGQAASDATDRTEGPSA